MNWHVDDVEQDAQLIISKDEECSTGQVRLTLANHTDDDIASMIVDLQDLQRVVGQVQA